MRGSASSGVRLALAVAAIRAAHPEDRGVLEWNLLTLGM